MSEPREYLTTIEISSDNGESWQILQFSSQRRPRLSFEGNATLKKMYLRKEKCNPFVSVESTETNDLKNCQSNNGRHYWEVKTPLLPLEPVEITNMRCAICKIEASQELKNKSQELNDAIGLWTEEYE